MERLNLEQLARLVDEPPKPEERAIMERDPALRRELEGLRSQTEALRNLPAVLPPPGGWRDLEEKLIATGLIFGRRENTHDWRKWLQAAAAVVIFIGGTTAGWITASAPARPGSAGATSEPASYASIEEAGAALEEVTQQWWAVYGGLQQLRSAQGQQFRSSDPAAHLAALETLTAATRAAVEESPHDQFLNELYVRMMAERNQTIRQFTLGGWY